MNEYIGLDVSMKETAVSIRRGGQRIWRGKCLGPEGDSRSHPPACACGQAGVFETGPRVGARTPLRPAPN
jgi:transposase